MLALLNKYKAPGGSLVVIRDGKLILARGYGWADVEGKVPVQPDSLFRLAISKVFTATGIMKLVEEGKLSVDTPALDILSQLKPAPGQTLTPASAKVTVRQLLWHAGGWDRDKIPGGHDPMFSNAAVTRAMGVPSLSVGYSISGYGNAQLTGSPDLGARVKLVGDPRVGTSDSPYNRINPAAFLPPQPGSIGLESGYNYLRNPGLNNWDLSLQKSIPLKGERSRMELRGDAFNVFNHPEFNGINSTASFASPTSTAPIPSSLFPANLNGFGMVSDTAPPRIMQVMVRLVF